MSKRFCEQCGSALVVGARFCASCGARVDVQPPAQASAPEPLFPAVPRAARPSPPADGIPHLPVQRGPSAAVLLGGLALLLMLLGGGGFWLYGHFGAGSGIDAPAAAPSVEVFEAPAQDPEALIPGRAPPTAGGSRPSVSVADDVPVESADIDLPVQIDPAPAEDPRAVRGPPPRLHGVPAATEGSLPPIPITDHPVDLDGLRAAVRAANARDIDALYAASPDPRGPETRVALEVAIRALAKGLYRHQVVDGHGDLEAARAELRAFLRGLEHQGLGLSEEAVEAGVAHVGP